MLSLHDQSRGPWILLHVVSGPWTSIVAALDKGRFNMAVCGRYKRENTYLFLTQIFIVKLRDNPKCDRCEEEEPMEHLLYGCENYSTVVWSELSTLLTNTLAHIVGHNIGRIDLTINHIIFNIPHQSLGIYLEYQLSITTILHLIQEQKRDIICRRMTLTTPRGPIPMPRIHAHILSVLTKITSLLEYQGAKSQSDPYAHDEDHAWLAPGND
jgi:hypothetical protein